MWISVDKTADTQGRYVAIVLIGTLDKEFHVPYLVAVEFLEKTNSGTIAHLVSESFRFLWPDLDSTLLKVFVSVAAAYMLEAG